MGNEILATSRVLKRIIIHLREHKEPQGITKIAESCNRGNFESVKDGLLFLMWLGIVEKTETDLNGRVFYKLVK